MRVPIKCDCQRSAFAGTKLQFGAFLKVVQTLLCVAQSILQPIPMNGWSKSALRRNLLVLMRSWYELTYKANIYSMLKPFLMLQTLSMIYCLPKAFCNNLHPLWQRLWLAINYAMQFYYCILTGGLPTVRIQWLLLSGIARGCNCTKKKKQHLTSCSWMDHS